MEQYPNREVYDIRRLTLEETSDGYSLMYSPKHNDEKISVRLFSKDNVISELYEWLNAPYQL